MAKVPLKFYRYQVNNQTYYDVLPQGSVRDPSYKEVSDLNEVNQAISQYSAKTDDWSQNYVSTLQRGLQNVQSGASPYVLNDKGVLATQQEVAAQQKEQADFAAGKTINIGTVEAPRYVPKGTPTPEEANKTFQASQPRPTYQEFDPKTGQMRTTTPTPGTGDYIGDLAKAFSQIGQRIQTEGITDAQGKVLAPGATAGTPQPAVQDSGALRVQQRKQEIERIKQEMEEGLVKPTALNSVAEFDRMRKEQGIVNDEGEMQAIQNEALQIKQSLREFSATAGQGVSEGGRVGAVSEAERNASFRLEGLAIREQAVVARLSAKNSYIDTMLKLGQQDYQNSLNEYNAEYQKNLHAIEAYNKELNDNQKDALTAFTTTANLLKDKNLAQIDPNMKTQMDSLALRAGLPVGTFESMLSATGGDEILSTYSRKEGIFSVLKGTNGIPYVKQLFSALGGTGGVDETTGLSSEAQAVINGTLRLEDLTPTVRGKIAGELTNAGYKSGPKLTASQQEDIAQMKTVNSLLDQILAYNADGKLEGIGSFGLGTLKSLGGQLGLSSKEAMDVRALIGNVKGTIAKLRGGTSFTTNEEKLLDTYTPAINDSPKVAINKINLLKNFINQKNANLLGAAQERGVPSINQESLRLKYNY